MRPFALATVALCSLACAGVPPAPVTPTLEEALAEPGARVMWVGAHPDDESLVGAVLARACVGLDRPCALVVMNKGQGGECLREEGCWPSVARVRAKEMLLVARGLGAELHHFDYFNAPLPVSSFPPRPEIGRRWVEAGDPAARIEQLILQFRPTVLLTFDPNHGFTGHPEHQLASRFAMAGVRRAAERGHRVEHVFHGLNRFWMFRAFGGGDPATPTQAFDTHVTCGGRTCLDVALDITKAHRSQARDMGNVRSLRPQLGELYLRRVDVFDPEQAPAPLAE